MAPIWTTPMNWDVTKAVTAARLNQYIGDNGTNAGNLAFLLNGRLLSNKTTYAQYTVTGSFADVDATNLISTVPVTSGRVAVWFSMFANITGSGGNPSLVVDVIMDSLTRAGDASSGVAGITGYVNSAIVGIALFPSVSTGSHTFKLQAKAANSGGTGVSWTINPNANGVAIPGVQQVVYEL